MSWQAGRNPDGLHGALNGTIVATQKMFQIGRQNLNFRCNLQYGNASFIDFQPQCALRNPGQFACLPDAVLLLLCKRSPINATTRCLLCKFSKARSARGGADVALVPSGDVGSKLHQALYRGKMKQMRNVLKIIFRIPLARCRGMIELVDSDATWDAMSPPHPVGPMD